MLLHDGIILLANADHILLVCLKFLADKFCLLARLSYNRADILAIRTARSSATLLLGQALLQSNIVALFRGLQ